jgi:glycine/D-amino acid oxidase-like deaminating enzyme
LPTDRFDAVIAGAGIAGAATAWALAKRGVRRAVIVDPRPPLTLTSNRPEANYRTWWPQPAMVALALRSLALIDELRAEGAEIPMDRRGYLFVTGDAATAASLPTVVAAHPAALASAAEALDSDELHSRWPHLAPKLLAGIFVLTAGGLDTVALGRAMLDRAGVEVIRGRLTGIEMAGGRVVGAVIDGDRRLETNVVVNAAGPYARDVARAAGADLPLETVVRQKIVVDDVRSAIPRAAPFTISMSSGLHVKPDDTAGPRAIKIGWAYDQTPAEPLDDPQLPAEFPRRALAEAAKVVPGLGSDAPVAAHEGGYYARTPDGLPLIGQIDPDLHGLYALAGLAGFGAMMATAAGELLAAAIVNADVSAAFRPDRIQHKPAATGEL